MVPRIGRKKPIANHSQNELPFQRPMKPADRPQKKQMTTSPRPCTLRSLEDADGPDDREDREYRDDDRRQSSHDPDHNLEQDPGGNDEDEDGQRSPAEVSCCCAHVVRVRAAYSTKGGLVGTYRSRPGNGTEHMTQLGQKTRKPRPRRRCSRCHDVVLA